MSFISASGLPADVHQQLCNNLMAAAEGAWDCGFDEPPFTPGEPPSSLPPYRELQNIDGLFICVSVALG